jgi:hypothetical protein
MKRIERHPEKFQLIDFFEAVAREKGLKLSEPETHKYFINRLAKSFQDSKDNPIIIHGRRIESMFEYVAASLGKSSLIKREDSGEICSTDPGIRPPDFRIILDGGTDIFVEVKNCHKTDPNYRFSLKHSYTSSIESYAKLFKRDIYIAIFWSRWRKWSLLRFNSFSGGERLSISFLEAFKHNEMAILGDTMIATIPPLAMRVVTDPTKPRRVDENGHVEFTIGALELYCGGVRLEDKFEQSLAFCFMLHSEWVVSEPEAKIEDGNLAYCEFVARPEEPVPEQQFQMLGFLSEMISRNYNDLTASSEGVESLSPRVDPDALGILIPEGYKGKQLPLWRFTLKAQ